MKNQYLLWLSFVEGALVLGVELCGTKLLSPMLGSTVYVWAFMLSITLLALAAGYFAGGILSEKFSSNEIPSYLLLLASLFALIMPFISEKIFFFFGNFPVVRLLALECFTVLFVPLFLLGCISPVLIGRLSVDSDHKAASRIFAVSTFGGIVAGAVLTFILIGKFGVKSSILILTSIAMIVASVRILRKALPLIGVYALIVLLLFVMPHKKRSDRYEVLYHQNGILGDIRVVKFAPYDTSISKTPSTWVFVNNISQTMYDPGAREKFFTYNYRVRELLAGLDRKDKLLLCGMGGGSIINVLKDNPVQIDVCELDERMPYIATKYFGLMRPAEITIDDARHFIRTSRETYDAVILDIFKGEETPNHVLSMEGLEDLKKIIHDSTLLIVNSHGYLKGSSGEGNRVLYKTLTAAGFHVNAEYTAESEEQSNLLFICRLDKPVYSKQKLEPSLFQTSEPVLTDKRPRLEKLNREAALRWRRQAQQYLFRESRY